MIKNKKLLFTFFLGLLLGLIIFASVNYFINRQTSTNKQFSEKVTQPVTFNIDVNNHIKGDYNAPIDLVVFNDYTCKYCQQYALSLEKLVQQNPSKVRIIWKHFPLNQNYLNAAMAAECASAQGKFWEYSHKLYSHASEFTNKFYLKTATALSLELPKFSICLASNKYVAKIQADYYEGLMKGVIGAPATFINGEYIPGVIPIEKLEQIINGIK